MMFGPNWDQPVKAPKGAAQRFSSEVYRLRFVVRKLVIFSACLALGAGCAVAMQQQKTATKPAAKHHRSKRKASWKKKGQQAIKPERALEIQQALIREKYLTGEPTGVWDARTQAALVKFQGDNGWQTKVVPDSRALIKLGLGPNYSSENLINGTPVTASAGATNTATSRAINGTTDKR